MVPRVISSIYGAFTGPAMQKFGAKITSRAVIAPILYAILCMIVFALVYALIGYSKLFEVNDENKNKNWENSVVASVMLQSNAMGDVSAKNSLGRWLMTAQVMCGWLWFMVIASLIM